MKADNLMTTTMETDTRILIKCCDGAMRVLLLLLFSCVSPVLVWADRVHVCPSEAISDDGRPFRPSTDVNQATTSEGTSVAAMAFLDRIFRQHDRNGDGRLSAAEYPFRALFAETERNGSDTVTITEFKNRCRKRFQAVNLPGGLIPLIPPENLKMRSTTRMKHFDGLIAWVFDIEVKDVEDRFRFALADLGANMKIPLAEILDLDCGTVNWGPDADKKMVGAGAGFRINLEDLTGRAEYVLRKDGKVVGMVGLIGDAGYINPRHRGQAKPVVGLSGDGQLMIDILPPFEGRGGALFRVFLCPLDDAELATFRIMVASSERFSGGTGKD